MAGEEIYQELIQGFEMISEFAGAAPVCSAAPAWRVTDEALLEKVKLPFRYNSDCRGTSIFYPVVKEKVLSQPQIPTTLPTFDEVLGRDGITQKNYNEYLLSLIVEKPFNVLAIHAEVEGMSCLSLFQKFLNQLRSPRGQLVPLGRLLSSSDQVIRAVIGKETIEGREGWLSVQQDAGEDR
jgi:undecaprenyl phosphate-alpha-L-ara4FN deformylase